MTITNVVDEKPPSVTGSETDSETDYETDSETGLETGSETGSETGPKKSKTDPEDSDGSTDPDFTGGESGSDSSSSSGSDSDTTAPRKVRQKTKAPTQNTKAPRQTAKGPGSRRNKETQDLIAVATTLCPTNEKRVRTEDVKNVFTCDNRLIVQVIRLWVDFLMVIHVITLGERKEVLTFTNGFLKKCDKPVKRQKDVRDPKGGNFVVYTSDSESDTETCKRKSVGCIKDPVLPAIHNVDNIRDAMESQQQTRENGRRMAVMMFAGYKGFLDDKKIKFVVDECLFDSVPLDFCQDTLGRLCDLIVARLCANKRMCHTDPFRVFELTYLQHYACQLSWGRFNFTSEQLESLIKSETELGQRTMVDEGPEDFDLDMRRNKASNTDSDGSDAEMSTDESDAEMPMDASEQANTTIYPDSGARDAAEVCGEPVIPDSESAPPAEVCSEPVIPDSESAPPAEVCGEPVIPDSESDSESDTEIPRVWPEHEALAGGMAPLLPYLEQLRAQGIVPNKEELNLLQMIKVMLDTEVVAKHLQTESKFVYEFPRSEPVLQLHDRVDIKRILKDKFAVAIWDVQKAERLALRQKCKTLDELGKLKARKDLASRQYARKGLFYVREWAKLGLCAPRKRKQPVVSDKVKEANKAPLPRLTPRQMVHFHIRMTAHIRQRPAKICKVLANLRAAGFGNVESPMTWVSKKFLRRLLAELHAKKQ